jgi:hypothetical protein
MRSLTVEYIVVELRVNERGRALKQIHVRKLM